MIQIIQFDWNRITIEFNRVSIDLNNDWAQLADTKRWNWIEFNILKIYFEHDRYTQSQEIKMYLLGFGIRIYWSIGPLPERIVKAIEEYKNKN